MAERFTFDDERKPLRVLVVDDCGAVKSQLARIIHQHGCIVAGLAANGQEAVAMYKKLAPDLVTMDVEMPEVNGLEALREIIEYDKGAVVIMVTTVANKANVLECLKSGAKNYILKPFTPEGIKAAIAKCFPRAFSG